jgi:hypothetical protein
MSSTRQEEEAKAEAEAVTVLGAVVMEDLEREYVAVVAEKDALQKQLAQARTALQETENQVQQQRAGQRTTSEMQHTVVMAEQRVAIVNTENQNLQERMDRMQAESDKLREEIR